MSLLQPMQTGATLTVHPMPMSNAEVSPKTKMFGMLPKSVPMSPCYVDLF